MNRFVLFATVGLIAWGARPTIAQTTPVVPIGIYLPIFIATEPSPAPNVTDLQAAIESLPVLDDAYGLTSENTDDTISVSYKTRSGIEEAAEFYQDEMERNGYSTTQYVVTPTMGTLRFEQDSIGVQVEITEDGDNNLVALTVESLVVPIVGIQSYSLLSG